MTKASNEAGMISAFRAIFLSPRFPVITLVSGACLAAMKVHRAGGVLMSIGLIMLVTRGVPTRCLELATTVAQGLRMQWASLRVRFAALRAPVTMPAWLELAWYVIALGWFLAFFLPTIVPGAMRLRVISDVLAWVSMLLGAVEWFRRVLGIFRRSWTRLAGKLIWSALTALFMCVATAWAREFTFHLAGEDPAAFPSFVAFVAVLMLPLAWWFLLCSIAVMWATIEALLMMLVCFCRLGRESVDGDPGRDSSLFVLFIMFMRPVSALAVVVTLLGASPRPLDPAIAPWLGRSASTLLVGLEYWPRTVCGISKPIPAVKLDSRRYSVFTSNGFHTVTCGPSSP